MTTEIAKIWKTHNCLILFDFFLCFEVRFLRPLSSFCCSSRSITLKEPISRKGFFSLVDLITFSLEKEGCFFGEILFIGQNVVIKCVDSCKTRYDNYRITIGLHPTRRNFFLKPTRTLAKSENICIVFI